MILYKYKIKKKFFFRTVYINYKGPEKNSASLEVFLDLSWFRYEMYIKQIWDKKLDLTINNFFTFYRFLKKIKELTTLSLNLFNKIKSIKIVVSKLYQILFIFIKNIKHYVYINLIDNLDFEVEQILFFNSIIENKLSLLKIQLNKFKDIINNIKIINLKEIKLILKQLLFKPNLILSTIFNKNLYIEVFDFLELCSTKFFLLYTLNEMLYFDYLSIFKIRIDILQYNAYNYPYYNYDFYKYNFYNVIVILFKLFFKLCFIKYNIISNNKNNLIQNYFFFRIYLLNNINIFYFFKESKLELLRIILFIELFFLCCSFIAVLDTNFDNFYLNYLNFIQIHYFELLNLLEFMFINVFKKKYYFFNLYISNLIKNFLNNFNLFKLYLIKYYNLSIIKMIKSVYSKNYVVTIKVLTSLYNFNNSLNILNDSFEFIKLIRSLSSVNFKIFNYLFNQFYNIFYYFDSIIQNLNYVFLISLKQYEKNKIVDSEINLDLIKPTPYKNKMSMEEFGEEVQLKMLQSKRSKPRNLTIYQTNSLIEFGVLEPKKKLTKKELYKDEWGVSWEFAQENKDYMLDVSNYILRRNIRRQNRLINNNDLKKKILIDKSFKIKSQYDIYYLHNKKALNINVSVIKMFNIFLYFKILNNFKIFNSYRSKYLFKNYKKKKNV